jgi:hypothetical protein
MTVHSHPLNTVLVPLLDEPDALEDVGDVVDPPLLLDVQHLCGNLEVEQPLLGLLQQRDKLLREQAQGLFEPGRLCAGVVQHVRDVGRLHDDGGGHRSSLKSLEDIDEG